uniref:Uncharacterized protein n=1 Tax=Opuntia streptacantha TaxID=393608 RepID=A0A7C9AIP4_OPUST
MANRKTLKDNFLSPLKVQAPEIKDSLVSCALCLNLGLLWAYFYDGSRVCWQFDMGSYYDHVCILLHHCTFSNYCMYLLYLLICLMRGNVEIPAAQAVKAKNHPIQFQHGLCMSFVRIVVLMFSYKTKYLLEGVLSVMLF